MDEAHEIRESLRCLETIMEVQPLFGRLLPCAAEETIRRGFARLDALHCFSALLTEFRDSPVVEAALFGHSVSSVSEMLYDRIWVSKRNRPPFRRISHLCWKMIHATCADASITGYRVHSFHVLLYFLVHPDSPPYFLFDRLKIERRLAIERVIEASFPDSRVGMAKTYYLRLNPILSEIFEEQLSNSVKGQVNKTGDMINVQDLVNRFEQDRPRCDD